MRIKRAIYLVLAVAATAWLPACAGGPQTASHLKCPAFAPNVTVQYGDSYLEANALKKVKPGCPLVFVLQPRGARGPNGLDYNDAQVTIKGKDGSDGAHWIGFSDTAADTPKGRYTATAPADQAEGTYFYLVAVDKVGSLDPRVIVEK